MGEIDQDWDPLDGLRVFREIESKYLGKCAVDATHPIFKKDVIGLIGEDPSEDLAFGWACRLCTEKIKLRSAND